MLFGALLDLEEAHKMADMSDLDVWIATLTMRITREARIGPVAVRHEPVMFAPLAYVSRQANIKHRPNL